MANLALCVPFGQWDALLVEVYRVLAPGGVLEVIDDEILFPYGDEPNFKEVVERKMESEQSLWEEDEEECVTELKENQAASREDAGGFVFIDAPTELGADPDQPFILCNEDDDDQTLHGDDSIDCDTESTLHSGSSGSGSRPSSFENVGSEVSFQREQDEISIGFSDSPTVRLFPTSSSSLSTGAMGTMGTAQTLTAISVRNSSDGFLPPTPPAHAPKLPSVFTNPRPPPPPPPRSSSRPRAQRTSHSSFSSSVSAFSHSSQSSNPSSSSSRFTSFSRASQQAEWRSQAFASRDLETTFTKMLEEDYGILPKLGNSILELLEGVFVNGDGSKVNGTGSLRSNKGKGKVGKTRSFHIKLAPSGSPIATGSSAAMVVSSEPVAFGDDGDSVRGLGTDQEDVPGSLRKKIKEKDKDKEKEWKQWKGIGLDWEKQQRKRREKKEARDSKDKEKKDKERGWKEDLVSGSVKFTSTNNSKRNSMERSRSSEDTDTTPTPGQEFPILSTPVPASLSKKAAERLGLVYVEPISGEKKAKEDEWDSDIGSDDEWLEEDLHFTPTTAKPPLPTPAFISVAKTSSMEKPFSNARIIAPPLIKSNSTPAAGTPTPDFPNAPPAQTLTDETRGHILSAKAAGRLGISYTALTAAAASASPTSISFTSAPSSNAQAVSSDSRIQHPGLLVWPSTYISLSPLELEMHACKYIHTLLGCLPALTEYVGKFVDEQGRRWIGEDEFRDVMWDYECFRRGRLGWPAEAAGGWDLVDEDGNGQGNGNGNDKATVGGGPSSPTTSSSTAGTTAASTGHGASLELPTPIAMSRSASGSISTSGFGLLGSSSGSKATSTLTALSTTSDDSRPSPPSHSHSIFSKTMNLRSAKSKYHAQMIKQVVRQVEQVGLPAPALSHHERSGHARNDSVESFNGQYSIDDLVHVRTIRVFEATKARS